MPIGSRLMKFNERTTQLRLDSENGKELTMHPTAEHFHTTERLRQLEAEATTPWVK
jgi:hypothetical protein